LLQASTLSARDRLVLEASLSRMVGDIFGALATLPLICLGDLPSPDPGRAVAERYDVWRSCLIVAREILRSSCDTPESASRSLDALLMAVGDIRDGYGEIADSIKTNRAASEAAYGRLADAYGRLPDLIRNFAGELGIDCTFLPAPQSVKHVASERSLRWFGEETRSRMTTPQESRHQG
jgi:hypothetical protein